MKKKEHQRCSQRSQAEEAKEVASEHPSLKTLIGATDAAIIQVARQVYQGEWTLASSMFSHQQHDDCMRELQQEVTQCMARAGLQSATSLTRSSRSRRHSQGCSTLQTHPLQNHRQGKLLNNQEKTPPQDGLDHGSNVPIWRERADQGSAKGPHWNAKGNPCHHPLVPKGLVIQVSDCVSICETWNYRPGPKKQVTFNIDEELGGEPTFPTDVTLFLSRGETIEWYTTLTPTTTGPIDTLQPNHEEGPPMEFHPTRRARPKVPAWPSATWFWLRPEGPDPVSHPQRWIQAEMLKMPHIPCWKTLMPWGKRIMFSHILCESLNKPKPLCLAHWQVVAFWLLQAQQEAAGWWAHPLAIPGLHLGDYRPSLLPLISG